MAWVDRRTYAFEPRRSFPLLHRWIATANHAHPIYSDPSVVTTCRAVINPTTTTKAQILATWLAQAQEDATRRPRSRSTLLLANNFGQSTATGRLIFNTADKGTGGSFAPGYSNSLFSDVGRADVLSNTRTIFTAHAAQLTANGLKPPRLALVDLEPSQYAGHGYGVDFSMGASIGWYTPCARDRRTATAFGSLSALDVETLRTREGYTYDDGQGAFSIANRLFNANFLGSLPLLDWALSQSMYRAAYEAWPWILCGNYNDYCADNAAFPYRDALNPTLYSYNVRALFADFHSPVLFPMNWTNGAALRLPGETHSEFFVRQNLAWLDSILAGSRASTPMVPWLAEPGILTDGAGYAATVSDTLAVMQGAWLRGVDEFALWGNDDLDPRVDDVWALWSAFRAWVAAIIEGESS